MSTISPDNTPPPLSTTSTSSIRRRRSRHGPSSSTSTSMFTPGEGKDGEGGGGVLEGWESSLEYSYRSFESWEEEVDRYFLYVESAFLSQCRQYCSAEVARYGQRNQYRNRAGTGPAGAGAGGASEERIESCCGLDCRELVGFLRYLTAKINHARLVKDFATLGRCFSGLLYLVIGAPIDDLGKERGLGEVSNSKQQRQSRYVCHLLAQMGTWETVMKGMADVMTQHKTRCEPVPERRRANRRNKQQNSQ